MTKGEIMTKIGALLGAVLVCFVGFTPAAPAAHVSKHPVRCFRAHGWIVKPGSTRHEGIAYPSAAAEVFGPAWAWVDWLRPFLVVDSRSFTPAEHAVELACVGGSTVP